MPWRGQPQSRPQVAEPALADDGQQLADHRQQLADDVQLWGDDRQQPADDIMASDNGE